MFITNERSGIWGTLKGLIKSTLDTGKEKSLKLRREKIFETLLCCCEKGELPIDSKLHSKNMFFIKCLLRSFFHARKQNSNYHYAWNKLESTHCHQVTI